MFSLILGSLVAQSNEKKTCSTPGVRSEWLEHLLGLLTVDCSYRGSVTASVTLFIFQSQLASKEHAALTKGVWRAPYNVLAKIQLVVFIRGFWRRDLWPDCGLEFILYTGCTLSIEPGWALLLNCQRHFLKVDGGNNWIGFSNDENDTLKWYFPLATWTLRDQ